jgi:hypothetical protein
LIVEQVRGAEEQLENVGMQFKGWMAAWDNLGSVSHTQRFALQIVHCQGQKAKRNQ